MAMVSDLTPEQLLAKVTCVWNNGVASAAWDWAWNGACAHQMSTQSAFDMIMFALGHRARPVHMESGLLLQSKECSGH